MRISLGNKIVYECERITICLKSLAEKFDRILTIKKSSSFNNYIQDSLKDYYEKSPNATAINVAHIFTNYYPNEMSSNDSYLKLMEEMNNLTSIIQEQQISTHIVHYTDRGVFDMTYNIEGSGKFIIDNQFKCRELGFTTRKNGTFCDKDMAGVMNPCKTSRRHYSVVAAALDRNMNLDESLNHIINISLNCNKAQSTNKVVLVPTEAYKEFICQDKDSCQNMWSLSTFGLNTIAPRWAIWPGMTKLITNNYSYREDVLFYLTIALTRGYNYGLYSLYIFTNKMCSKSDEPLQDVYSGLLKEFFDELQSLIGELSLNANWISLYDHPTNSTCDTSMVVSEQEIFQFYHIPLNATTEDIGSLIVCPTTAPSENFVSTNGLENGTMISYSSTPSDISSTKNITNESPDTSEESKKSEYRIE
uniref:Uncharacterized protein n=1 Tax=Acrobeloides nanus TaxID=290746 RepID=A0A914E2T1_9BILA